MLELVGNPDCWFSHAKAQISYTYKMTTCVRFSFCQAMLDEVLQSFLFPSYYNMNGLGEEKIKMDFMSYMNSTGADQYVDHQCLVLVAL